MNAPTIEAEEPDGRRQEGRLTLETMMKNYEYQSDFAKKYVAQGRVEEAGRAVLTTLRVRGIVVSAADRERILAEKDTAKLERWHERAILAASIDEVLNESNEAA